MSLIKKYQLFLPARLTAYVRVLKAADLRPAMGDSPSISDIIIAMVDRVKTLRTVMSEDEMTSFVSRFDHTEPRQMILDLPQPVHAEWKTEAAKFGVSIQEYIIQGICIEAAINNLTVIDNLPIYNKWQSN